MALTLAACGGSSTPDSGNDAGNAPEVTPITATLAARIDTVTGITANDTINAGLNANSTQTLQGLDMIDGGVGTDTANVVFNTTGTPTLVSNYSQNLRLTYLTHLS